MFRLSVIAALGITLVVAVLLERERSRAPTPQPTAPHWWGTTEENFREWCRVERAAGGWQEEQQLRDPTIIKEGDALLVRCP